MRARRGENEGTDDEAEMVGRRKFGEGGFDGSSEWGWDQVSGITRARLFLMIDFMAADG